MPEVVISAFQMRKLSQRGSAPPQRSHSRARIEHIGHSTSQGCLEGSFPEGRKGKVTETKGSAYAKSFKQVPFSSSAVANAPQLYQPATVHGPRGEGVQAGSLSHSGDEDRVFLVSPNWLVTSSLTACITFVASSLTLNQG